MVFLLVEGQPRAALVLRQLGPRRDQQQTDASPSSQAAEAIRRHPAAAMTAAACAGLLLARNPELCRRLLDLGELMLRDRLRDTRTGAGAPAADRSGH